MGICKSKKTIIHAHFIDRKGFKKDLLLERDYPPHSYRFAAVPRLKLEPLNENEIPSEPVVNIVEFYLKDAKRRDDNTIDAWYEEE
jgi:hypothetical protein